MNRQPYKLINFYACFLQTSQFSFSKINFKQFKSNCQKNKFNFCFKYLILYIKFLLFKQFCENCMYKNLYRNGDTVSYLLIMCLHIINKHCRV